MRRGETSAYDANRVASEPAYNVSVGAAILAGKWRAAACVGSNDQDIIEHWYFAVWGYNGFAFSNNPNNPAYRADRPEFNSSATATSRRAYPYQELVWGFAHFPPSAGHYRGQGLGYPRRSEICASCGFPMAAIGETPIRTPATCGTVTPPTPRFGAAFVMQSFPLARTTLDLPAGSEQRGFIELRNTGTETWRPNEVFLGTTTPRDRASPARGTDWVSAARAATVDRVVAPMAVGRFNFSLRASTTVGQEFNEYFGVVREGIAWFSDTGQGGPPDNQLQIRVRAIAGAMDAGVTPRPDASAPVDAGPPTMDATTPAPDASTVTDSGARADARRDAGPIGVEPSGCGCAVPAATPRSGVFGVMLSLVALAREARRRRRHA
jgi:MYXO-CTERM domain-containing protein